MIPVYDSTKKLFLYLFLLFIIVTPKLVSAEDSASPIILRVAVINQAASIELSVKGPCAIKTLYSDALIETCDSIKAKMVLPVFDGIEMGGKTYKIFGIKITPQKEEAILINGRRYRGEIDVIRTSDIKLLVVNHIGLEEYLYGVLYHEVSHRWPIEALKAQAIVSRTYALYQKSVNQNKEYDLTSDFYSQVYGGRTSEKYRTTRAVNLTRGQVLTYKGKIFPTYFHATCAGATEDASELWDVDLPPLKGVKCDFCLQSPHYRWENFVTLKELKEKLSAAGYGNFEKVFALVPYEKDASGRIRTLSLITDKGKIKIPAKEFRQIFGPQLVRSTNFEAEVESDALMLHGYGWGHGVGLCQWGAYFMALKGYKADEILKFYYSGTEIKLVTSK